MAVHPAGDGAAWESDVDVDQPHGLDYRYINHVAKAVANRLKFEHEEFADATVGGTHKPGGCAILGIDDATADMTAKAGDATGYRGRGLVYDQTNNVLWCWTADGTTSDDPYQLMLSPASLCLATDWTFTGAVQFDGTQDFMDEADFSAILAEGTVTFTALVDMSTAQIELIDATMSVTERADFSSLGISGDVTITADVDVSGDVNIDGQLVLDANNVYDSSWFDATLAGTYTKTHDLSSTLVTWNLWIKDISNQLADGINRIYSVNMGRSEANEEGACLKNLTTTQATIQVGSNAAAMIFTSTGGLDLITNGSYRLVMTRLI